MTRSVEIGPRSACASGVSAAQPPASTMSILLHAALVELNLDVPSADSERLLFYLDLIARWNRVYNLTAIREPESMLVQHLFDSLAVAPDLRRRLASSSPRIVDVGSGAGLPGLPLALIWPQARVHLVEPVGKKAAFLRQAAAAVAPGRVEVHASRVQDLVGHLQPPDLVICRAFASLAEFAQAIEPLLGPHTLVAAMKGRRPDAEIDQLPSRWSVGELLSIQVPRLQAQRHLVILRGPGSAARVDDDRSSAD